MPRKVCDTCYNYILCVRGYFQSYVCLEEEEHPEYIQNAQDTNGLDCAFWHPQAVIDSPKEVIQP